MCRILQEKCRHFTKCNDHNLFVCARKSFGFVMPPFSPRMLATVHIFQKPLFLIRSLFVFMFVEFITRFECLTCYKIAHQTEIKWSENCFKLILKNKSKVHRKREKKQPQFCVVPWKLVSFIMKSSPFHVQTNLSLTMYKNECYGNTNAYRTFNKEAISKTND